MANYKRAYMFANKREGSICGDCGAEIPIGDPIKLYGGVPYGLLCHKPPAHIEAKRKEEGWRTHADMVAAWTGAKVGQTDSTHLKRVQSMAKARAAKANKAEANAKVYPETDVSIKLPRKGSKNRIMVDAVIASGASPATVQAMMDTLR